MPDSTGRKAPIALSDRLLNYASAAIFYVVTLLFILVSILLICLAFDRLLVTAASFPQVQLDSLFETIGFTTVAAAVFELARTMYEEEIRSLTKMTAPLKIRHFISRFLTVIVISLSIEFLTMVFRYSHKTGEFVYMYEAAAVAIGIALIFFAWAYYNKTSVYVEQHEHEICDTGDQR